MQDITEEKTKTLLKGIMIPPQPQIMVDLHAEMENPNMNMAVIATIIAKDIGLSGSILKVVNSPFFGLRHHVTSIQQALNLLGSANVINIVNSVSIRNHLSDSSISDMTAFWDNAMDTAMIAGAVAKITKIAAPDEAYTLGLFHDAGIPLMMLKFKHHPKVLRAAYKEQVLPVTDIENQQLETNHAVIGYFVAKTWKLPNYLSEAIADHHKTGDIFSNKRACNPQKKNLLAVLKLAETISQTSQVLGHVDINYEFERIKSDLFSYLNWSEYDFEEMQEEIKDLDF